MPFALLFVGILLVVAAVRDTQGDLFKLVIGDFTGKNNFLYWVIAFLAVGMLGYIPKLKPFSNAFLVLIAIVILLSNKGFFTKFQQEISSTTNTTTLNTPGSTTATQTQQGTLGTNTTVLGNGF